MTFLFHKKYSISQVIIFFLASCKRQYLISNLSIISFSRLYILRYLLSFLEWNKVQLRNIKVLKGKLICERYPVTLRISCEQCLWVCGENDSLQFHLLLHSAFSWEVVLMSGHAVCQSPPLVGLSSSLNVAWIASVYVVSFGW